MTLPRYLIKGGRGSRGQSDIERRERNDKRMKTFYKRCDAFLMFKGLRLFDQVDLILENDDVLEFHDLHGCQMLRRLGLRTRFVGCDEKKCGVHDRCAVQHGSHENVVPWTVDE